MGTHSEGAAGNVPRQGDEGTQRVPRTAPGTHAGPLAPVPAPAPPGSMTVPPLFGWETIVAVLVLLVVVAVVFFVASAAGRSPSGRSDFEAWLQARSARHPAPLDEPVDSPPAGQASTSPR